MSAKRDKTRFLRPAAPLLYLSEMTYIIAYVYLLKTKALLENEIYVGM